MNMLVLSKCTLFNHKPQQVTNWKHCKRTTIIIIPVRHYVPVCVHF